MSTTTTDSWSLGTLYNGSNGQFAHKQPFKISFACDTHTHTHTVYVNRTKLARACLTLAVAEN